MVLRYYGAGSINPLGNFQCGVVAVLGGQCWNNCGQCVTAVGHAQNLVNVLVTYRAVYQQQTGHSIEDFSPSWGSELSEDEVAEQIDNDYPIIAGISPSGASVPNGWGLSQHVVVVTGYTYLNDVMVLTVNDPYPYPFYADPYRAVGGQRVQPGRYRITYEAFLHGLHYQNSITFD